ncbi:MAG: ring-cleaving dioxygenase [Acidobacteriota bacterium]
MTETSKSTPQPRPQRPILGLHHVTAIASDPQRNLDFYAGVLGLRLVKKTVNFDDPGTYHLYFGDAEGSPGSILTFFPWPGARQGHAGNGQTQTTTFAAPASSLGDWRRRLAAAGVAVEELERFGDKVLRFTDPDGLGLEVAGSAPEGDGTLQGFDAVTLQVADGELTTAALQVLGFRDVASEGHRRRFEVADGGVGARVDVVVTPQAPRARSGAGTVHHVAFRNADDASQAEWRGYLGAAGLWPTDVKDRQYFHSIYFREPGGVLFELATDPPGFAVDEAPESLGEGLMLPPWFEARRSQIEASLPPLRTPESEVRDA